MGRQKGYIPYNRYDAEKEKLVVNELLAGKSFRTIRGETGISMKAIQAIKKRCNVVQPVKQPKPKEVITSVKRSEYKQQSSSHVPLTHIRNGESFIMDCF